jgi:hypothetical protein
MLMSPKFLLLLLLLSALATFTLSGCSMAGTALQGTGSAISSAGSGLKRL